jgi:hypothetical protein
LFTKAHDNLFNSFIKGDETLTQSKEEKVFLMSNEIRVPYRYINPETNMLTPESLSRLMKLVPDFSHEAHAEGTEGPLSVNRPDSDTVEIRRGPQKSRIVYRLSSKTREILDIRDVGLDGYVRRQTVPTFLKRVERALADLLGNSGVSQTMIQPKISMNTVQPKQWTQLLDLLQSRKASDLRSAASGITFTKAGDSPIGCQDYLLHDSRDTSPTFVARFSQEGHLKAFLQDEKDERGFTKPNIMAPDQFDQHLPALSALLATLYSDLTPQGPYRYINPKTKMLTPEALSELIKLVPTFAHEAHAEGTESPLSVNRPDSDTVEIRRGPQKSRICYRLSSKTGEIFDIRDAGPDGYVHLQTNPTFLKRVERALADLLGNSGVSQTMIQPKISMNTVQPTEQWTQLLDLLQSRKASGFRSAASGITFTKAGDSPIGCQDYLLHDSRDTSPTFVARFSQEGHLKAFWQDEKDERGSTRQNIMDPDQFDQHLPALSTLLATLYSDSKRVFF